jgi:hypothetical protein
MKSLRNFIFVLFAINIIQFFISCSNFQNESTSDSTVQINNYRDFIQTIINKRSSVEKSPGFEIEGKLVYISSDSTSYIITFSEGYDEWKKNRNYSIAVNFDEEGGSAIYESNIYDEFVQLLGNINFKVLIFDGELKQLPYDINRDGIKDFLLTKESMLVDNIIKYQRAILTENEKNLIYTQIFAETYYQENNQVEGGKNGKVEELSFNEKNGIVTITLMHNHNETHHEWGFKFNIDYELKWQWDAGKKIWEFGVVIPNRHNIHYANLKGEYAHIYGTPGNYYVQEDCQRGGIDGFIITDVKGKLSASSKLFNGIDYIIIYAREFENVGTIIKVIEIPYEAQDFSFIDNKFGWINLDNQYEWVLSKNKNGDDEWYYLSTAPDNKYTLNPKKYNFKNCED